MTPAAAATATGSRPPGRTRPPGSSGCGTAGPPSWASRPGWTWTAGRTCRRTGGSSSAPSRASPTSRRSRRAWTPATSTLPATSGCARSVPACPPWTPAWSCTPCRWPTGTPPTRTARAAARLTVPENAGHTRRCPVDGSEHYPRTDPAVIMLVLDADDRLLLGRQTTWPEGRFSTLAGFVEPGESLEAAVRREVHEECGIEIGDGDLPRQPAVAVPVQPDARLLGAGVDHRGAPTRRRDRRGPLVHPRRRCSPTSAPAGCTSSPSISISRRLIEHWYGEPLPAQRRGLVTAP